MGELTKARQAALLAYCRVNAEETAEVALIEALYDDAVGYMARAGVAEPGPDSDRRGSYDLCVNYLVLDAYDRRDMTITGTIVAENPAFRRRLNQLKMTEPVAAAVSNSDTGGGE